jgi:uncharacterized damage-inducible protein DinB
MITTLAEFEQIWGYESGSTAQYLAALTDASLAQPVGPDDRTLGRMAWHVVTSVREMMERTGLKLAGAAPEAPVPASAAEIARAYATVAASLIAEMRQHWTDATLLIEDDMYGQKWNRATTLNILITHQTHHRGQMSVLMRQAGLVVPGIYGPAREGWAGMGMSPPEV